MKNYVYLVHAYYDMNLGNNEEIYLDVYALEEDAQKQCRDMIARWKSGKFGSKEDCTDWYEGDCRLYAWKDSEWNVDIYYTKEEVR